MKPMTLLLPLMVCSCQTAREVTLPNGARYADNGHFAGDTTVMMEPDGTVILRNRMNAPWRDFLQAAAFVFGVHEMGNVATADIARRKSTSLAAQRAATARAANAAELERLRLIQDFEKFKLLNPVPTPIPAGLP